MEVSDQAVLAPKLCGRNAECSAALQNLFCFCDFVRVHRVDKTERNGKKNKKKNCVDKQTSLNNSGKTFANQHAVAPVKTCRLFPLWTPADIFDAALALCTFIQ